MKRETYYRGIPGKKWGIWNTMKKEFQFDICEDTPMLAQARLYQKIGDDARKYRFEVRQLPERKHQGKRPHVIYGDESSPFGAKEAAAAEMIAKRQRQGGRKCYSDLQDKMEIINSEMAFSINAECIPRRK